MKVHTIRLRGPWQQENASGRSCWRRRFGCPTGLAPQQRIWIVVEGIGGPGEVVLNGGVLGRLSAQGSEQLSRFDVSDVLRERNELAIRLDYTPSGPGARAASLPGEVRLEIEEPGDG